MIYAIFITAVVIIMASYYFPEKIYGKVLVDKAVVDEHKKYVKIIGAYDKIFELPLIGNEFFIVEDKDKGIEGLLVKTDGHISYSIVIKRENWEEDGLGCFETIEIVTPNSREELKSNYYTNASGVMQAMAKRIYSQRIYHYEP